MGRIPCCEKDNVKRGQWTPEEDNKLSSYIAQHGTRNWRMIPKNAGLQRCGKSCRLRWTNYLRPDLKRGHFSDAEEQTIIKIHSVFGNRWSLIADQLPGRTDNDVKNYWNTKLKKKLSGMGIDPVTHKPFSHLMAEIATLAPPQLAHLAEATLGCFKDEMLHLLTKKRIDVVQQQPQAATSGKALLVGGLGFIGSNQQHQQQEEDKDNIDTIEKIKLGLSRAIQDPPPPPPPPPPPVAAWDSSHFARACNTHFPGSMSSGLIHHQYGSSSFASCNNINEGDDGSPWNHEGMRASGDQQQPDQTLEDENANESEEGKENKNGCTIFNPDCILWDIPSEEDLLNPIV